MERVREGRVEERERGEGLVEEKKERKRERG